jgi:GntR family transcriptional regulator
MVTMAAPLAAALDGTTPLYREVKRLLTRALADGRWAPGEALPSESRLAATFGVSIGTLRKAVDELVAERVLVRRQGSGTFVATHGASRYLFHFFHVVPEDGDRVLPEPELLAFERGRATPDEAAKLGLAAGERVHRFSNLLRIAGAAVALDEIVLPHRIAPDLTERVLRERASTIYHLYQVRYGVNVVRAVERLRARIAARAEARTLELEPSAAVLEIRRLALTYHDRPVELRRSVVNTLHHEYFADIGGISGTSAGAGADTGAGAA